MPFTIAWASIVTCATLLFATCGRQESQHTDSIKRDHAEISKMLDQAMLSTTPTDSFHILLPKVRSYPTVDSAWIDGRNFYVQYKGGGIVSWTAPIIQPKEKGDKEQ